MTTNVIGSTGNFTTLQSWEDACPANLTTAQQIWRGEVQNQEFVGTGNMLTISGTTTNATYYIELTTAAGAGFKDHASKATNPYRYNASVGAAIRMTGDYAVAVLVDQPYTRISGIQLAGSSTTVNAGVVLQVSGTSINCDINGVIVEGFSNDRPVKFGGAGNVLRNSLVVQRRPSAAAFIMEMANGSQAYNCTLVATGAKVNAGLITQYAAGVLKNCYVGNVTAPRDAGTAPTMTTNFSDTAATGFAVAPFSTATFVSVTDGSHDFRLAAGSTLIDAGTADATYSAADALGTTRSGTTDVGAVEYAAVTIPSVTGSAAWTEGSEALSASGSAGGVSAGTFSTPVLRNNTGTALVNESGVVVNVYNSTTGALVVRKTGLTSNASGIVTVSDGAIVAGTSYAYEVVLAANGRRLPVVAAA